MLRLRILAKIVTVCALHCEISMVKSAAIPAVFWACNEPVLMQDILAFRACKMKLGRGKFSLSFLPRRNARL